MSLTEDIADELALESLRIINATGDDAFVKRVADAIGGSSQTMEEAYLTAVRVRRAEQRARTLLKEIAAQALAQRAPSSADD